MRILAERNKFVLINIVMLTTKQCMELYDACKPLSKNVRFIPGASYKEFVHQALLDVAVKTVAQGVKAFIKLLNKALNDMRTSLMDADKLSNIKTKSTEITRNKIANNPAYRASHNADCNRWEKEQRENETPYNTSRIAAKAKLRSDYKANQKSKEPIKCDILQGKCNRMPHKHHYHQGTNCPLASQFNLKRGICYCLKANWFKISDIVYKVW